MPQNGIEMYHTVSYPKDGETVQYQTHPTALCQRDLNHKGPEGLDHISHDNSKLHENC